jgi:hypothetical protein
MVGWLDVAWLDEWMSGWLYRCLIVRLSGLSGCLLIWWSVRLVCLVSGRSDGLRAREGIGALRFGW